MQESPIVLQHGSGEPDAAVIWLHGLGADGHDFEPIVPELNLPPEWNLRFVFPHAPMRPVTLNNGFVMRAWFDIYSLDIGSQVDEEGIRDSQRILEGLIEEQLDQGIDSRRIVLAGFSQGGTIALYTGLRYARPLAGLMGLSTVLAPADTLERERSEANLSVPIFLAHGDRDPVLAPELGYRSRALLERLGYAVEWHEYSGMQHSVSMQEIRDISDWLQRVLG